MVESENSVFMPDHPNANIHGMITENGDATCLTRNPDIRCTGCCFALHITSTGNEEGTVLKEAGEMCLEQIPTVGCGHIVKNQPEKRFQPVCGGFHCSTQIDVFRRTGDNKARIKIAWSNKASNFTGEIDEKTMDDNLKRVGI